MDSIPDSIEKAKAAIPDLTPTPPGLTQPQASVHDLKARLEWGEPALTILDVRDRASFNQGHIMGAMTMPMETLVEQATSSLEPERNIYIYGESDAQSAEAANLLRQNGFVNVAELQGGLSAWKAIAGSTDGTEENVEPGPDAYNVVSRVQHHLQTQKMDTTHTIIN